MDQEQTKNTNENDGANGDVHFGGGYAIAVTGIVAGLSIVLGFSWILLAYGQVLGTTVITVLLAGSLIVGGGVAVVSAFFGLVMPRLVRGRWRGPWPRHKWGSHCGTPGEPFGFQDWAEMDFENWTQQDWKNWAEKMKQKWVGKRNF
jgi:hypothetical protein